MKNVLRDSFLLLSVFIVGMVVFSFPSPTYSHANDAIHCRHESDLHICPIAWHPNKNQLAVRDLYDIVVWDIATGEVLKSFGQEGKAPDAFAWSPDGELIVTADGNYDVNIWDVQLGEKIRSINMEAYLTDDFEAGRIDGPFDHIEAISWSPAGDQIAVSHDGSVSIWNWEANEFRTIQWDTSGQQSRAVAWNFDGTKLAVVNVFNFVLYDGESFEALFDSNVWNGAYYVNWRTTPQSVAWSPDEEQLAVTLVTPRSLNQAVVYVNNVAPGQEDHILTTEGSLINAIAWSAGSNLLASANGNWLDEDNSDNSVRVWDMSTYELVEVFSYDSYVISVSWSPDGKQLAISTSDGNIEIKDFE
ncbi:MAG: hypothetical protein DPW16_08400 [Chloroflexi bacterium]|nr:hypothetical protein [Chloroflexota bacterium]